MQALDSSRVASANVKLIGEQTTGSKHFRQIAQTELANVSFHSTLTFVALRRPEGFPDTNAMCRVHGKICEINHLKKNWL